MAGALLVVDDDRAALRATAAHFGELGYEVFRAAGPAAMGVFERCRPDVVVLGLHLPGPASAAVFEGLRARGAAVVLLLGHGFSESEVRLLQLGAEQVLRKPIEVEHLEAVTARVLDRVRTAQRGAFLRSRLAADPGPDAFGVSPAMRALTARIRSLAAAEGGVVLFTGEPGVGKGRAARLLHAASRRASGPFVETWCAAAQAAVAAQLFGAEPGADGDGAPRRPGLFELADGGTLFLDELLALDAALQPAVVAVLASRRVRRAGGEQPIAVDVRAVAATSAAAGAAGLVRDLSYRLDVVTVHLPPLRERAPEDRAALAARLADALGTEMPGCPSAMDAGALERLVDHDWPGNVREMRNVLEYAMMAARGAPALGAGHLPAEIGRRAAEPGRQAGQSLDDVERRHIERTLRRHADNRTRAAEELGIARATLINKIRSYALDL